MTFLQIIQRDLSDVQKMRGMKDQITTSRAALRDLVEDHGRLDSIVRANYSDPDIPSRKDIAIAHGKDLASAADNYLQVVRKVLSQDIDIQASIEELNKAHSNLELKVFDFRKTAARAA